MNQSSISILALTVVAAGALAANRFVTQTGAYPAAGALAFGVGRSSAAAAGDLVPVDVQGTAIVECAGTIAVDDLIMSDANGAAVLAAGVGKVPLARSMAAGVSGGFIEVLLIPNGGHALAA